MATTDRAAQHARNFLRMNAGIEVSLGMMKAVIDVAVRSERMFLTPKQKAAFLEIKRHIVRHNTPPTIRELARSLGTENSNAHRLTKCLEDRGYIRRAPYRHGGITII